MKLTFVPPTHTLLQFSNSCTFFILAIMGHYNSTVLCHMDHDVAVNIVGWR